MTPTSRWWNIFFPIFIQLHGGGEVKSAEKKKTHSDIKKMHHSHSETSYIGKSFTCAHFFWCLIKDYQNGVYLEKHIYQQTSSATIKNKTDVELILLSHISTRVFSRTFESPQRKSLCTWKTARTLYSVKLKPVRKKLDHLLAGWCVCRCRCVRLCLKFIKKQFPRGGGGVGGSGWKRGCETQSQTEGVE